MKDAHLPEELAQTGARVSVETKHGKVTGGRALNGSAVFLEVPYGLPPNRFEDPKPLPADYVYEDKDYIHEKTYAAQPKNDGQAGSLPFEDKVGLGNPSENPLFVNIACPPDFPIKTGFPVRVYIHGGFLQFGSPHSLMSQPQYISAERSEVWVNIGYRLSAFGFLASDEPDLHGNYGFMDQYLALEWIRDNIEAFGGDPSDIRITGLSAGGHSVHQILHHVSHLPDGVLAPFQSAVLQSNAIMTIPKTPAELRAQYAALCSALDLDPASPDTLPSLRDSARVPAERITHVIETDAVGTEHGTYRGCLAPPWLPAPSNATASDSMASDPMAWQRSGALARALRTKGVRSILLGDTADEWYLYSIAHPIAGPADIAPNLRRYYADDLVDRMMGLWRTLPEDAPSEDAARLFGEILCAGQVHVPVRLLHRDLVNADFPVVRYEVRWAPEGTRKRGQ
ncbi:Alpha/Beta hydrolase protein [Schizophyllum amplum]|uniref:Carboxylic ester hydrolase n=1 Tax=Schizophyllum amplum TaxID=97359 RepID=A0A550C829_9AGAR|nr:Alpha/Beta hydrolase protein [Auriculariopsis ampla]